MAKIVRKQKSVEKVVVKIEKSSMSKMKLVKKIALKLLIVLLIVGVIYFGKKMFFVASANGQLISRMSVIKELEKQGGQKTLDTVILKTLINQEAKKKNVNVTEKELDAELVKIEKNVSSQGTTLDALLIQQGMTKSDLENEIKLQLLVTKLVGGDVSVTEKEVDDYLNSQKEQVSLTGGEEISEPPRAQVMEQLKQQKTQAKIQAFVADLKAKAKITYFMKY